MRDARRPSPVAIVAAGGDGTVLDLINRHPLVPIAVLPLGTENLLARQLDIPHRDGRFVARMIAAGRTTRFDLGTIGARRFAIMASCGFDATVLAAAHAARTGHITRRHYIAPTLRTLRCYRFPELRVYLDDETQPRVGSMVVVANMSQYAARLPLVRGADPTDGQLDVRIFTHHSTFQLLRDLSTVVLRRRGAGLNPLRATRVRIESDAPLPLQADGDPAGTTPVEIGIIAQAATLIIPDA
jgi:diacylglycerol kinase family enzyme